MKTGTETQLADISRWTDGETDDKYGDGLKKYCAPLREELSLPVSLHTPSHLYLLYTERKFIFCKCTSTVCFCFCL